MFISQLEPHHQNDHGRFEGYLPTLTNYKNYPIPDDLSFLKGDYNEMFPDYLSAVNRIDYNLGKLINKLKSEGLYDDTVIIYTSDHGCHFKTRNAEYKRCCHDNTIKTPLVIKGDVYTGGVHYSGLISLLDLPPVILSIAGIKPPDCFDGYNIHDFMTSEIQKRECVYIQLSESQCGRAIRTEKYTYSVKAPTATGYAISHSPVYIEDYLYDNEKDPFQKNNLIKYPEYANVRKTLENLLKSEAAKINEKPFVVLPAITTSYK